MIIPVVKKDLATLAGVASGKGKTPITCVVELSYKDGTCKLAATDSYVVAVVVLPGFTPEEVKALPIDFESVYINAESLRKALKQIPRSKQHVCVSVEGQNCQLVTDSAMYDVDLAPLHDRYLVSKYEAITSDRLAHAQPNAYAIDSKRLKKAVDTAHALNLSGDPVQFRVLKRTTAPAFEWLSYRPLRGYAKVVTTAKYGCD